MIKFISTLLISTLMGMGIGGGGLYIVYLTLFEGVSSHVARGTNLIFFVFSGISAIFIHIRKRKIFPLQVLVLTASGALGSLIFSQLGNILDPEIPKKVLGSVLILAGAITLASLFRKEKK